MLYVTVIIIITLLFLTAMFWYLLIEQINICRPMLIPAKSIVVSVIKHDHVVKTGVPEMNVTST